MSKMHPCCGGSLQTGTKVIAVLHLVFSIFIVTGGIIILCGVEAATSASQTDKVPVTDKERNEIAAAAALLIVVAVILIIVGTINLLLAVFLLTGANKRNRQMCMIWFVLNVFFLVCTFIEVIFSVAPASGISMALVIIQMLVQSYLLWVVWAFMEELREEAGEAHSGNSRPRV